MSNTDGEETNIDMLTRRVINHLNDYAIKGVLVREDVNNMVIESRLAQKQLASLREQLAKKDEDAIQAIDALTKQIAELMHQLKQKEDENRELVDGIKNVVTELRSKEAEWENHSTAKASVFDYAASKIESVIFRLSAKLGKV